MTRSKGDISLNDSRIWFEPGDCVAGRPDPGRGVPGEGRAAAIAVRHAAARAHPGGSRTRLRDQVRTRRGAGGAVAHLDALPEATVPVLAGLVSGRPAGTRRPHRAGRLLTAPVPRLGLP